MDLNTAPNFDSPDDFYEALLDAHRGLSVDESHAFNARLVLVLANHIGAMRTLEQALQAARDGPATQARHDGPAGLTPAQAT